MEYSLTSVAIDHEAYKLTVEPALGEVASQAVVKQLVDAREAPAPFSRALVLSEGKEQTIIMARPNRQLMARETDPQEAAHLATARLAQLGLGNFEICEPEPEAPSFFGAEEFAEVYRNSRRHVRNYARKCLFSHLQSQAEDVAQETFTVAWAGRARYERALNIGWLVIVARRKAFDQNKGMQASPLPDWFEEIIGAPDEYHDTLEYEDMQRLLESTIALLPPRQREILERRWLGMSTKQIATELGIAENVVRSNESFARAGLIRRLRQSPTARELLPAAIINRPVPERARQHTAGETRTKETNLDSNTTSKEPESGIEALTLARLSAEIVKLRIADGQDGALPPEALTYALSRLNRSSRELAARMLDEVPPAQIAQEFSRTSLERTYRKLRRGMRDHLSL